MQTARARTLARLRALAAVGAATTTTGCNGCAGAFGVVDPLPAPTCFDSPKPTATAAYLQPDDVDAGGTAPAGSRLVEVQVSFEQTDVVIGKVTTSSNMAASPELVHQTASSHALRFVLRVFSVEDTVRLFVDTTCKGAPRSSLYVTLTLGPTGVDATAR